MLFAEKPVVVVRRGVPHTGERYLAARLIQTLYRGFRERVLIVPGFRGIRRRESRFSKGYTLYSRAEEIKRLRFEKLKWRDGLDNQTYWKAPKTLDKKEKSKLVKVKHYNPQACFVVDHGRQVVIAALLSAGRLGAIMRKGFTPEEAAEAIQIMWRKYWRRKMDRFLALSMDEYCRFRNLDDEYEQLISERIARGYQKKIPTGTGFFARLKSAWMDCTQCGEPGQDS